jgi:hypothetical protein
MQPSVDVPHKRGESWVYASLSVRDGQRVLKPSQVAYDRLIFTSPPRLTSERVEIILVNGDAEQRHTAVVLPHDPEATRVPIRLLSMD